MAADLFDFDGLDDTDGGLEFVAQVQRVVYHNPGTNWTITKVRIMPPFPPALRGSSRVTVKGVYPAPPEGAYLRVRGGTVERDPKYAGLDVSKPTSVTVEYGLDDRGLIAYLTTLPNIGQIRGAALVRAMGREGVLAAIDKGDVTAFTAIPGISEERAREIIDAAASATELREATLYLAKVGCPAWLMGRILDAWKVDTLKNLARDPYDVMRDLRGVGFAAADDLAKRLDGVSPDLRDIACAEVAAAAVLHGGHCWIEKADLAAGVDVEDEARADVIRAVTRQKLDPGAVLRGLDHVVLRSERPAEVTEDDDTDEDEDAAAVWLVPQGDRFYPEHVLRAEKAVATNLRRIVHTAPKDTLANGTVPEWLDDTQREAVAAFFREGVMVLTGGPGTGKTAVTKVILDGLDTKQIVYSLCAPTGKAAMRMTELTGRPASTIHRLLGRNKDGGGFMHGAVNPLPAKTLVVDECFAYRQRIYTADGWEYIGRIVRERKRVRVWSRNPSTGRLELKPITRWITRPAPATLLRIDATRTASKRDGRLIRCTPEHKIATPCGYRRAGTLVVGDQILVRGWTLTPTQHSVLVGSVLGDGAISQQHGRNSPQFTVCHGQDQRAYLEHKHSIFGALAGTIETTQSGYAPSRKVHRFHVRAPDAVRTVADEMRIVSRGAARKRWAPTDQFLSEYVNEHALAIWFLDNGSVSRREVRGTVKYAATLHTERFSGAVNTRFAAFLHRRFGLTAGVHKYTRGTRVYFYLRFKDIETNRLLALVRPFVPSCMAWKVPDGAYVPAAQHACDTTIGRIRSITTESAPRGYPRVYDLEVGDNHNYVAGNIIVSNCSMIDICLMSSLLAAIASGARVLFVGDVDQLPPVGPGAPFADIIASGIVPSVRLTTIHRQASESRIPYLARDLNAGHLPVDFDTYQGPNSDVIFWQINSADKIADDIVKTVVRVIPEKRGFAASDIQVISPQRGRTCGVRVLNARLQEALNPSRDGVQIGTGEDKAEAAAGDKIIHRKNNYRLMVFNGEVGRVVVTSRGGFTREHLLSFGVKTDEDPKKIVMLAEYPAPGGAPRVVAYTTLQCQEIQLAYAITCHGSQGSGFPVVVVPVHQQHAWMLTRSLVYTAVTRAEKMLVLIGQKDMLERAATVTRGTLRRTSLRERLTAGRD